MTDNASSPGVRAVTAHDKVAEEEEFRLALVLNGGVSLAVWMGGVALEIQRMTQSSGARTRPPESDPMYGPILWLTRSRAVVDVISGTSAGGINGAALALAQVNARADLTLLRGLWSNSGRMEELLRQPFQGQPSSMLRGDEYFLPELQRAMKGLAEPFEQRLDARNDPRSLDLSITTTLLNGSQLVTTDDFGQRIPQRVHAATFEFALNGDSPRKVDVNSKEVAVKVAAAMALAARSTASFPFAFEASFVPVDEDPAPRDPGPRPGMQDFASWKDRGETPRDQSRFAVDGGVLANTPTRNALKSIGRRRADGPVRRSMLLVFPHAPAPDDVPADKRVEPPTALGAMQKVLGALQAQGSRNFVEEIEEHNRIAADWRGGRLRVLRTSQGDPADLYQLARVAWPHYVDLRRRKAALDLASRVEERPWTEKGAWPFERIRRAAEAAQSAFDPLPYTPAQAPPHAEADSEGSWQWGFTTARGIADAVSEILRAAISVAQLDDAKKLGLALGLVSDQRKVIEVASRRVDDVWTDSAYLRSLEPSRSYWWARLIAYRRAMAPEQEDNPGRARAQFESSLPKPDTAALRADRTRQIALFVARSGEEGKQTRTAVHAIVDQLATHLGTIEALAGEDAGNRSEPLVAWTPLLLADPLSPPKPGVDLTEDEHLTQRLLDRLLAVDVATWLVADGPATGTELPIKLAQLSLQTVHPWARQSTTPDDKASGMELARFGGFLKRSWRMNDWTWGRLDAALMLCLVSLDPERLSQLGTLLGDGVTRTDQARALLESLEVQLCGDEKLPRAMADLRQAAELDLRRALAARDAYDDTTGAPRQVPAQLPDLAAFVAFPLQARIILEELPMLATAIKLDANEGASTRSRGQAFLIEQQKLIDQVAAAKPGAPGWLPLGALALEAFDVAGIGREPLSDEAGSDAMVRTSAKATGVLATVLDSSRSGAKFLKPVTSVVRGAASVPYWIITGLAGGAPLARFLASLGLVAGGMLLVLSLLGVLGWVGPLGGAVGAATVLAALGYSAMRTGSLLHGVVLLGPAAGLLAFGFHDSGDDTKNAAGVLSVLALAGALWVIGRTPWPLYSPRAMVVDTHRRLLTRKGWYARSFEDARGDRVSTARGIWTLVFYTLGFLAMGAGALIIGYALGEWAWNAHGAGFEAYWHDHHRWILITASVVCVLLGWLAADRCSKGLRIWHRDTDETFDWSRVEHGAGVAASWAGVYGFAYLALAWLLGLRGNATGGVDPRAWNWVTTTVVAWAFMGVVLLLVAPFVIPRRAYREVHVLLRDSPLTRAEDAKRAGKAKADTKARDREELEALRELLLKYNRAHWHFYKEDKAAKEKSAVAESVKALALTRAGQRLLSEWLKTERAPVAPETSIASTDSMSASSRGAVAGSRAKT